FSPPHNASPRREPIMIYLSLLRRSVRDARRRSAGLFRRSSSVTAHSRWQFWHCQTCVIWSPVTTTARVIHPCAEQCGHGCQPLVVGTCSATNRGRSRCGAALMLRRTVQRNDSFLRECALQGTLFAVWAEFRESRCLPTFLAENQLRPLRSLPAFRVS